MCLQKSQAVHSNEQADSIVTVKEQIRKVAEEICFRLDDNPDLMSSAMKFVKRSAELVTDLALESALASFGRYTGAGIAKCTKSKLKRMTHGTKIGGQPTTVARRKTTWGVVSV